LANLTDFGADALAPVSVTATQPVSFYPHGVDLLMSMSERLTPTDVPTAMNGTWVLMLGFSLPVATAAAARELFPGRPRALLWAGLAAPMMTARI